MGLSDKPQDYDYSLERRIKDVEALLDSLRLKRVHLVVHDWGGAIGFGVATRRPDFIGRIAITNTAAFPSHAIPGRIALCRARGMGEFLVRGFNGFAWPATWMAMSARTLTSEEKRGFLFPYDSWANRIAIYRFVRDIPLEPTHPSRAVLEQIATRLSELARKEKLIVWGGKDFCFNDGFLRQWQAIYPTAPVHRFADAGHYVIEDSTDARRRIADFLLNSSHA
jgi:haloalkane dehalogenase